MRSEFMIFSLVACLFGTPVLCADDVADLLKVIQSPSAADVDRANAFERIGDVAGDDAVDTLAGFLGDTKWSHYARFALQKMPGQKATTALLGALGTVQGDLKVGLIVTIGRRQEPAAIEPLAKLLGEADAGVAAAAAEALGSIGTVAAVESVTTAFGAEQDVARKAALGSALLLAGQRLVKSGQTENAVAVFDLLRGADIPAALRIAATKNAILARGEKGIELLGEQLQSSDQHYFEVGLAAAQVLPGTPVTDRVIQALKSEAAPVRQVPLIQALSVRGDSRALPAILERLSSDNLAVSEAAITAVGALGDVSSVPTLLAAAHADSVPVALNALTALKGADVNAALMSAAKEPDRAVFAVRALGKRRATEAVDLLFQLAKSDSADVGREAIVALGAVAPEDKFLDLIALLKAARNETQKAAIQEAVHAAITRSTQPDLCAETLGAMIARSSGADRDYLFEQIRTAGGAKAVALMRQYAMGRDESLQDAATKTLGEWLSADAGPVLLEVAKGNGKFANRALGGYIRLFRQFELPEPERVAMAAEALKVAGRANERNAALEAITRFPCVGTYDLALEQLAAPGSETAAAEAALTIARTVLDLDPAKGKAGLQKLIDAKISDNVTASAKALLQ